MRTILQTAVYLALGTFAAAPWAEAARPQAALPRPSILLVTYAPPAFRYDPAIHYCKLLHKLGYSTDSCSIHDLKPERIRRYNLVVLMEMSYGMTAEQYGPLLAPLEGYLQEGGSLLLYAHAWSNAGRPGCEGFNNALQKWGGEVLYEQVVDPATEYFANTGLPQAAYYRTSNIANDPLTAGVHTIYYPGVGRGHFPSTYPLKLDSNWTVLVRASKDAQTRAWNDQKDTLAETAGEASPECPLVAVRPYKKGKIACVGLSAVELAYGIDNWAWGNIALKEGDGKTKSDFGKLMENLYAWMLQPSASEIRVGGYVEPPPAKRSQRTPPTMQWKEVGLQGEKMTWGKGIAGFGGVIGIHSTFSTGEDAPEAYIAKAREMGLDFIVFTEDFASMTPEKWKQLKAICEKQSDKQFLALPGIEYRDEIDRRFFVGPNFTWPKPGYLSADGKRLVDPNAWYEFFNMAMHGPFLVKQSPVGYWTFGLYDTWPIYTYQHGKQLEEAFAEYLAMNKIDDEPQPAVMDLIFNVADLQKADSHPRTYIRQGTLAAVKSMFLNGMYFTARLQYVSRGPRILDWDKSQDYDAGKDADNLNGWWHIQGGQRYRMRFRVESDRPLKEVMVYDGPDVIRRYLPNQAEFKQVIDLPQDRQRALCIVATDQSGRKAISGSIRITDPIFWRFMCGDRGNSICDSWQFDDQGKPLLWGAPAPYQRKGTTFNVYVGNSGDNQALWIPCVDGGFCPAAFNATPTVIAKGLTEPDNQALNKVMLHPMTSRDVCIQEDLIVAKYPKGKYVDVWHRHELTTPLELFENRVRYVAFLKRFGDPGVLLLEYELKAKRDVTFPKDQPLSIKLFEQNNKFGGPNGMDQFVFNNPPVAQISGTLSKAPGKFVHLDQRLGRGAVLFQYPKKEGAPGIFTLDDGLRLILDQSGSQVHWTVGLSMPGETVKKGTILKARLIAFRGRCGTDNGGAREMEEIRDGLGIGVKPAYRVDVKQGEIRQQSLPLDVEAHNGAFLATVSRAKLPLPLPIRIWGLNDKWTTGIYDRRQKRWNPFGIIAGEGVGYVSLDTGKAVSDVFIGNLLQCDNPDLILTFLENGNGSKKVVAHNPTDQEIKATVKATEGFDLIKGFSEAVKVPAGSSIEAPIND